MHHKKKELPYCYITKKEIPEKTFKYFSWEVDAYISAEGLAIIEEQMKKGDKEAKLLWQEWQWSSDMLDLS